MDGTGCEKDLTLNQITAVTVDRNPVTKEAQVSTIYMKHEEAIYLEKG